MRNRTTSQAQSAASSVARFWAKYGSLETWPTFPRQDLLQEDFSHAELCWFRRPIR